MKKVINFLKTFLHCGINISIGVLIVSVVIQVFSRFFLPSTPSWTEEVSRMSFIFTVGFAAPLALLENHLVRVDILFNKLSSKNKRIIDILINVLVGVFLIILTYQTYHAIERLGMEQTPILKMSLKYPMLLFFISYLIMFFFLIVQTIGVMNEIKSNKEV